MKERVVVVGTGKVAHFFVELLAESGMLGGIVGRNSEKVNALALQYGVECSSLNAGNIPEGTIYLVAVSDTACSEVVEFICNTMKHDFVVAHTSGVVELLGAENCGRFYPLQTFSGGEYRNISKINIFIEANDSRVEKRLLFLSKELFGGGTIISSEQLQRVHLAATFANNFTNYIYCCAQDLLADANLDISLLYPLMEEGLHRAKSSGKNIFAAQTGAAQRGDYATIDLHRSLLEGEKLQIYDVITKYILNRNE